MTENENPRPGKLSALASMARAQFAAIIGAGRSPGWRILAGMRRWKTHLAVALLAGLVSVACAVVGPYVVSLAITDLFDGVTNGSSDVDLNTVTRTLAAAFAIYVASALFQLVQNLSFTTASQRLVYDLRERLVDSLHRAPLSTFDTTRRGDLLSRCTNDVDNLAQNLATFLSAAVSGVMTVCAIVVMMLVVSPLLAAVSIVAVLLLIKVPSLLMGRARKEFIAQHQATGLVTNSVEEFYSGRDVVLANTAEEIAVARFTELNSALTEATSRSQRIAGFVAPVTTFCESALYVVLAVVGALRVAAGGMPIGSALVFFQYARQLNQSFTSLALLATSIQSAAASATRILEVLDLPEEVVGDEDAPCGPGRIEFSGVEFGYEPDRPVIHDVSLTIEPGSTVAVVGPTGAGKTTLMDLLLGFYRPSSGTITLDGVDVRDINPGQLRERIGVVVQEPWFFDGSILENLRWADPGKTDAEIREAASFVHVDPLIRSLPDGYDTRLDDDSPLSAGELQLVTLARAVVKDPDILVLDEAMSAVDTRIEMVVQESMASARNERTTIVIAHRLSTLRDADLVIAVEDGRIVEAGTHDELKAANGVYSELIGAGVPT